jgi:glycosyltransferase involved in cell wall biosynthesis
MEAVTAVSSPVTSTTAPARTGATRDIARSAEISDEAAATFLAEYADRPGAAVVVVIPALNEEESVASVVAAVPAEICGLPAEALVLDDGSTDRTSALARDAGAMVCQLPVNLGQGVAFRLGYRLARERGARFIATADADGQFDPGELPGLIAPLLADEADFVNGSRRLGRSYTTDPVRRLGVTVFGTLISALTRVRITDPANGLRAFRAEMTAQVPLRQTQYQTSELLIGAVAHGYRVKEAPVTMYQRKAGETKKGKNFIYGCRFARVIVTTWWAQRWNSRRSFPGAGLL